MRDERDRISIYIDIYSVSKGTRAMEEVGIERELISHFAGRTIPTLGAGT